MLVARARWSLGHWVPGSAHRAAWRMRQRPGGVRVAYGAFSALTLRRMGRLLRVGYHTHTVLFGLGRAPRPGSCAPMLESQYQQPSHILQPPFCAIRRFARRFTAHPAPESQCTPSHEILQSHSPWISSTKRFRAGDVKWYGLFHNQKLADHLVSVSSRTSHPPWRE